MGKAVGVCVLFMAAVVLMGMFIFSDFLYPATFAAAADQAARQSLPGYKGELLDWAASEAAGDEDPGASAIVLAGLPYSGYQGPSSFLCTSLLGAGTSMISDCFGTPRTCSNGLTCPHPGIDIATGYSTGHAVYTPWGGMVTFAGDYGAWGYSVVVENQGYQLLLTHLSVFSVSVGEVISAGSQVGLSGGAPGTSGAGSSSGPHLHFEVRRCQENAQGQVICAALDPLSVLLPGQLAACNWYLTVTLPGGNAECAR